MADPNNLIQASFSQIHGHYHDIVGEAFLVNQQNADILPRTYRIEFFIYLRLNEVVSDIRYADVSNGLSATENGIQTVWVTTSHVTEEGQHNEGRWLGYEFEITKEIPEVLVLEFDVNDTDTDPKPKVILEDPLEVDPDDGTGSV